jgi:hypothetical protein
MKPHRQAHNPKRIDCETDWHDPLTASASPSFPGEEKLIRLRPCIFLQRARDRLDDTDVSNSSSSRCVFVLCPEKDCNGRGTPQEIIHRVSEITFKKVENHRKLDSAASFQGKSVLSTSKNVAFLKLLTILSIKLINNSEYFLCCRINSKCDKAVVGRY